MATTYTVSNQSELLSTLSKASGGDTILLQSGNYGNVDFHNLNFNSFVTVKSADADKPAVFNTVDIDNASYLRVDGVHVTNTSNGGDASKYVSIENSDHVEFLNSEINGPVDSIYTGWFGIFGKNNTDLTLSGNYIHDVKIGMVMQAIDRLEVSENFVDHTGSDGFKYSSVSNFLIENNEHGGNFHPQPGAHLDFMQFEGGASSDGIIRGNVFLAESPANVQGIFMADVAFDNILIEQNIISTALINAIKVGIYGTNITARDNTVINIPDTVHNSSKVIGSQTSSGNLITSTSTSSGANLQIDTDDYANYFQGEIKLGMTLEDLRPVAGSAAEDFGALSRLAELLDGVQFVPAPVPEPETTPTVVTSPDPEPTIEPTPTTTQSPTIETDELPAQSDIIKITGSADVIEVAPGSVPDFAAAAVNFTFTADNPDRMQGLVSNDAKDFGNHFNLYLDNGMLSARFQTAEGQEIVLTKSGIVAGQTYDVSVTTNGSDVSLIVDGSLAHSAQLSWSWADSDQYLQIGANGWASSDGAAGYSDVFIGTIQNFSFEQIATAQPILDDTSALADETPISGGRLSAIFNKLYNSLKRNSDKETDKGAKEKTTVQTDDDAESTADTYADLDYQANPELTSFDTVTDEFVL